MLIEPMETLASASKPVANFDVIGLCASAGGLAPLIEIVQALPENFPAALLVVLHMSPYYPTQIATILGDHSMLKSKLADEGDEIRPGCIYVARPDRHLVVQPGRRLALSNSPRVCFTRPAADPLLFSMALEFRHRSVGVILSGTGHDGAMGIRAVKGTGGSTIAQERHERLPGMPEAATATGCVDLVLPSQMIARALIALTMVGGASRCFQSRAGFV